MPVPWSARWPGQYGSAGRTGHLVKRVSQGKQHPQVRNRVYVGLRPGQPPTNPPDHQLSLLHFDVLDLPPGQRVLAIEDGVLVHAQWAEVQPFALPDGGYRARQIFAPPARVRPGPSALSSG